jgi:hypothetical protein
MQWQLASLISSSARPLPNRHNMDAFAGSSSVAFDPLRLANNENRGADERVAHRL